MYAWSRVSVYRYRRGVCLCGAGYGCTDIGGVYVCVEQDMGVQI